MGPSRTEQFQALFDPRGVVVAGASTHPGKFGFVALHNILANGYAGRVFATNREAAPVLGIDTVATLDEIPDGAADLVFVCTPASTNPDLLRAAAAKGITAAFLASAGYGEAGEQGRRAQDELVALADDLGVLVVGPNGQGVVSTPSSLCAQIVAPYPPAGRIGVASQSGNFVSSFMNYACASGVGVSRAVSAGNSAMVGVTDFLGFYADDPATDVALAYVEGIPDGRRFFEEIRAVAERLPVVLVKGGATSGGQRAAASHTGSLATDDRVFDGMCRQAGVIRAASIEEAYEVAATFATQPEPAGPRVAVVTTAGGWGVITADAIAGTSLELTSLPDDLIAALDAELPPRWSRNNPIDLAGGETRDTITTVLEITARHPDVDGVILLGMGIQSNQAPPGTGGPLLSRPRPRPHRRLPRPPGPPLHGHRGGAGRRVGQARAGRHRVGGDLPRQRRGAGRGRGRQALLPVVQPGRGRTGPPLGAGSMAAPPPPLSPGAPLAGPPISYARPDGSTDLRCGDGARPGRAHGPWGGGHDDDQHQRTPARRSPDPSGHAGAVAAPGAHPAGRADGRLAAAGAPWRPIVAQATPTSCLVVHTDGRTIDRRQGQPAREPRVHREAADHHRPAGPRRARTSPSRRGR